MDILSFQEAKKVRRAVGETRRLHTDSKIVVGAINELIERNSAFEIHLFEALLPYVNENETVEAWFHLTQKGFIKGIKCSGHEHTGEFRLKIFTKKPDEGGRYIYDSGYVTNVLWDIMDIPFYDETGTNDVYVVLENKGALTTFMLQIFARKG